MVNPIFIYVMGFFVCTGIFSGFALFIVAYYFVKFKYTVIWELDNYGYGEERPLLLYTAWIYAWQRLAHVSDALTRPSGAERKYGRIINLWESPVPMKYKRLLVLMDVMTLLSLISIVLVSIMTYFLPS